MEKILVTTDFSEESQIAFDAAKAEANLIGRDSCEIHLVCVVEDLVPHSVEFGFGFAAIDSSGILEKAVEKSSQKIAALKEELFAEYNCTATAIKAKHDVAKEVIDYATDNDISLIVIATHGYSGFKRWLIGSVTERVLHAAKCPVFVIPTKEDCAKQELCLKELNSHIAVTTDFSDAAKVAYSLAANRLRKLDGQNSKLTLIHLLEELARVNRANTLKDEAEALHCELEKQCQAELREIAQESFAGLECNTAVTRTTKGAAEAFKDYCEANNVSLAIIATHGHSGIKNLLIGSVTEKVIRNSCIPVIAVPVRS